ncbi:MAG: hypothetical protein GKR94_16945 [Gammaproteobacteria bacterium]|nr:hypothetical protein [Gammaproteobacteria bacterium]
MISAREADKNRSVREAIGLYEMLVAASEASLTEILNLIVLYFNCMDLGYASAYSVGKEVEATASSRALELISIAEQLFGSNDEFLYWKSMIPFYGWGEPVPEWCLEGNSNIPYLYLAREDPTATNIQHVRDLAVDILGIDESERKRYIEGKIEQVLYPIS